VKLSMLAIKTQFGGDRKFMHCTVSGKITQ
jgi:hypothetical protein